MSAILDVLRMLGLEGSAIAAAGCVVVVFYMFRAKSAGARAASAGAAIVAYASATLIVIAAALAFGWIDPNLSVITEHLTEAMRVAIERGTGPARQLVRWGIDALAGAGG